MMLLSRTASTAWNQKDWECEGSVGFTISYVFEFAPQDQSSCDSPTPSASFCSRAKSSKGRAEADTPRRSLRGGSWDVG
jgi:hypothetical protein